MSVSKFNVDTNAQNQTQTASLLDPQPAPVALASLQPASGSIQRLVVLVPDLDLDEVELARRVWNLASASRVDVLFFALFRDVQNEPRLRRRLVTLSALTRDDRIVVETQLVYGRSWARGIRSVLREGDALLCPVEQEVGILNKGLGRVADRLGIPVWNMKGLIMNVTKSRREWWLEFRFWLVSIGVVAGFFWLQLRFLSISEDWARNALLYLSVPVEIGLLWVWHAISN